MGDKGFYAAICLELSQVTYFFDTLKRNEFIY
jgi:hypothetical protein